MRKGKEKERKGKKGCEELLIRIHTGGWGWSRDGVGVFRVLGLGVGLGLWFSKMLGVGLLESGDLRVENAVRTFQKINQKKKERETPNPQPQNPSP